MKAKIILSSLIAASILNSCSTSKPVAVKLSGPQVTASAKELVRITDDVVAEFQPCLSPNGKKLLYVIRDDANENYNKWSIRLKNDVMLPGFTPLIGNKTDRPSWIDNENFIFTYYASKPTIAVTSTNKLGLTYIGQNAYGDFDADASTSPDGKKIVLTTTLQDTRNICLVNKDGSSFTVLSEGINPKWNTKGDKLLYTKLSGDFYQLFELDLKSFQSTQITTGEQHSTNGAYSPDGKHVVYIGTKDKFSHLFVMKINGTSLTQITSGDSNETQPFWGVDGNIYFASTAGARQPEKITNNKIATMFAKTSSNNISQEQSAFSYPYTDIWRVQPLIVD
jgi:Tol biopolymer transport system component